jgi:exonuclease VII large subunit
MAGTTRLREAKLAELARTLNAVGPGSVLARGYAAIRRGDAYLTRASQLAVGDKVAIMMADGSKSARIAEGNENGE